MAREYRFFTSEISFSEMNGDIEISAVKESEIFNQLVRVLRIKPEDTVILLSGTNKFGDPAYDEFVYSVKSAHKKGVSLQFMDTRINNNEHGRPLDLVLCLPNKPEKLSFILQKAVEIGVRRVVLVNGDNSQMKHPLRHERLGKIMKEAAEQSERGFVPELVVDKRLCEYLENPKRKGLLFIAMEKMDHHVDIRDLLKEFPKGEVEIVIGPEGGFSENEKKFVNKLKIRCFSLGKRVLRMETAVIVALGVALMD